MSRPVITSGLREVPTGTRPWLVRDAAGSSWWAKWPGNPHGPDSLANELIVARLGAHIGAPIPAGTLLDIDPALAQLLVPTPELQEGPWFGSAVQDGIFMHGMGYQGKNGNPNHVPRYVALWQWCAGGDEQFIYDPNAGYRMWSIDHGLWFHSGESPWVEAETVGPMDVPGILPPGAEGAGTADAYYEAANEVESVTPEMIREVVTAVPIEWNIPQESLTRIEEFILGRQAGVVHQLRLQGARLRESGSGTRRRRSA